MSICWYCFWGWPKQVREIYDRYVDDIGESAMNYGPAHVVWCDENFESAIVESCIRDCDNRLYGDFEPETFEKIKQSLVELLDVPESIRCCCPDEYDGESPEKFPPPIELLMDKVNG